MVSELTLLGAGRSGGVNPFPGGTRVTEDSNTRVTEDGNTRITEQV